MIVTIASPDKVSIAMFISFMQHCLGKDILVGEIHSLMTEESINLYINDIKTKSERVLITYYARRKANVDPVKIIPAKVMEASDMVFWINLYSTELTIVKDSENLSVPYLENWKRNIDRINAIKI